MELRILVVEEEVQELAELAQARVKVEMEAVV
jgi:hypothetical protein